MKKIFQSFFGSKKSNQEKDLSEEEYKYLPKKDELVEDKFTLNFSSNGGKFFYATDLSECEDYFNKIIEEVSVQYIHENSGSCVADDSKLINHFLDSDKITQESTLMTHE